MARRPLRLSSRRAGHRICSSGVSAPPPRVAAWWPRPLLRGGSTTAPHGRSPSIFFLRAGGPNDSPTSVTPPSSSCSPVDQRRPHLLRAALSPGAELRRASTHAARSCPTSFSVELRLARSWRPPRDLHPPCRARLMPAPAAMLRSGGADGHALAPSLLTSASGLSRISRRSSYDNLVSSITTAQRGKRTITWWSPQGIGTRAIDPRRA
jgi:hypothetical protein